MVFRVEQKVEHAVEQSMLPGFIHLSPKPLHGQHTMADTRPLSSGLAGCCKTARLGGGLPASEGGSDGLAPRPWLPPDILRLIDAQARRLEREERLRAMHGGVLSQTLMDAAQAGGLRDVRFLLAAGAVANYSYDYPLRSAATGGHVAVMTELLEAGAHDINSAFLCAAAGGHVPAAALLLARGANIHYNNDDALQLAADQDHLDMAAFLLDNGADLVHGVNEAARQRARQYGRAAVEALLLQRAQA